MCLNSGPLLLRNYKSSYSVETREPEWPHCWENYKNINDHSRLSPSSSNSAIWSISSACGDSSSGVSSLPVGVLGFWYFSLWLWVLSWALRLLDWVKRLKQKGKEHTYGFSPVWVRIWVLRLKSKEKARLQISHLNGFSPVWTSWWRRSLLLSTKCLPQCWHTNTFSPVSLICMLGYSFSSIILNLALTSLALWVFGATVILNLRV